MIAARESVKRLVNALGTVSCRCPGHSSGSAFLNSDASMKKEYAYEVAASNIRYGPGVTKELGMDLKNLGAKKVLLMTDKTIALLPAMKAAIEALHKSSINFEVFEDVRVEPNDHSFQRAIEFAKNGSFDAFVAVGGGSVMDTCKVANLCASNPNADLLDFVNAPIGKGLAITHDLYPLIAVPTTAGTGSETTGTAIFDFTEIKTKTGISSRKLRPTLGLVDPLHTLTMPERKSLLKEILSHALESYTALPYFEREPRPSNPKLRPAYQGSNPISDVWSLHALKVVAKAVQDCEDFEARSEMLLASVFAGIGFGNAGCHLCHGMSYPIAGNVQSYKAKDYPTDHAIVPHGLSVVLTAPAVFEFTYAMCPDRHLETAEILGADIRNKKQKDAGKILSDQLRRIMQDLNVDDGLNSIGYSREDIPKLVKGTLPQERVTKLAPRAQTEEDLSNLFEKSLKCY
ncbi:DgyrCDS6002 [Dimorphilus gyrociliatus]|uniref:hydroxyacid-oxoacid transhydrogenase n=1 Tax=Dimorphilus gyrociliatus TaxID=2664684 RepID=A0A7I8VPI6_9ANNE|nr:DgyrCDS6002 [Dimorphilus gyrociliatus]